MLRTLISNEQLNALRQEHEAKGRKYQLSVTGSSTVFTSWTGIEYLSSESPMSLQDLLFVQKVQAVVGKRAQKIKMSDVTPQKPFRINFSEQVITDAVEIDLNHAYWRAAFLLGYLDQATHDIPYKPVEIRLTASGAKKLGKKSFKAYKYYPFGKAKGLKEGVDYVKAYRPDKKMRLLALGALNKQMERFTFDGSKMKPLAVERTDLKLQQAWNNIRYTVHGLMESIASELQAQDFFLYWVDALVVRNTAVEQVLDRLKQAGYAFKIRPIDRMYFTSEGLKVQEADKIRTFKIY